MEIVIEKAEKNERTPLGELEDGQHFFWHTPDKGIGVKMSLSSGSLDLKLQGNDVLYRNKDSELIRCGGADHGVFPCHADGTLIEPEQEGEKVRVTDLAAGETYSRDGDVFMVTYCHGDSVSVLNLTNRQTLKVNNGHFEGTPCTIKRIVVEVGGSK